MSATFPGMPCALCLVIGCVVLAPLSAGHVGNDGNGLWSPSSSVASQTKVEVSAGNLLVEPFFLSLSNDVSLMLDSANGHYGSARLHTLLAAMEPAILRVGGSPADWLYFDLPETKTNASGVEPAPLILTKKIWDELVGLTVSTKTRLLFDLDLQQRFGTQWDPTNAIKLFEYSVKQGYGSNIDWELGNEPTAYSRPGQGHFKGKQIARDFINLVKLVHSYGSFAKSKVVGPDVVGIGSAAGEEVSTQYLNIAGGYVDAYTFHHYYFRGDVAKWTEYLKPHHFTSLAGTLTHVRHMVANSSHPDLPIWMGETSDSWHSGTANVSDRYISGFLWLDKLGVAAREGVKVVMRQTFYGHDYCMIDQDMYPNPDYWLSLLHKQLVGDRVLEVISLGSNSTRVYAHCANTKYGYPPGAVTLLVLNINHTSADTLVFPDPMGGVVNRYILTPWGPDGLLSKTVALNGTPLKMVDDHTLPKLRGVSSPSSSGVSFPPLTFGFLVFPRAGVEACF